MVEAEDLVQDVVDALAATTARRRQDLAGKSAQTPEDLWLTLQRCRSVIAILEG